MAKLACVLALVVLVLVVESRCQARFIYPTYRPPPQPRQPVIRTARSADFEPMLATDGAMPRAFEGMDDDHYSRVERSLSTPGRGRVGSNDRGHGSGSRGQDTGATHPGYNRRNARSLYLPGPVTTPPFNPKPWPGLPSPTIPKFPIYV